MAIRLEYDVAMECKGKMDQGADNIQEAAAALASAVEYLRGSWEGASATQFFSDYDEFIKSALETAETNVRSGAHNLKIDADRIKAADEA